MSTSMSGGRTFKLATALAAVLVFCSIGAASASAVEWVQGSSAMKWSAATITLEKEGSTASCSAPAAQGSPPLLGAIGPLGGVGTSGYLYYVHVNCEGGSTFEFCACFQATKSTGAGTYAVTLSNRWNASFPTYPSPFGSYIQGSSQGVFTNGSAGTPSTLNVSKIALGKTSPGNVPITLSATFNVTTPTGGLLTLKG